MYILAVYVFVVESVINLAKVNRKTNLGDSQRNYKTFNKSFNAILNTLLI